MVAIGLLTVIVGFALVMIGSLLQAKGGKVEWATVGFIGPFPLFGIGSNKNLLIGLTIIGFIIILLITILNLIGG